LLDTAKRIGGDSRSYARKLDYSKLSLWCIKHHARKAYRKVAVEHCTLLNPE
jgi:hypothetical protein